MSSWLWNRVIGIVHQGRNADHLSFLEKMRLMPVSVYREFGSQADGANDKDGGQRSHQGNGDEATTHKSAPLGRGCGT